MALIADGVPMDKLYPLDVDRAFKKLEQLKPHVLVWWNSGAQSAQVLKDGEVDMVAAWNGRIQALETEPEGKGGKIKTTFNQQILVSDCWMIPKGAPNKDLAMKAIAIMIAARGQRPHLATTSTTRRPTEGLRHRRHPEGEAGRPAELARERQEGLRPDRSTGGSTTPTRW